VPYLKFSRDKRGYESFFLLEHSRVLFWFRTPPNVKVGREPFSDEVRRMVEAQNPDLTFDWARITSTPIPTVDVEHWRERRRAEKAARRAAREEAAAVEAQVAVDEAEAEPIATAQEVTSAQEDASAVLEAIESRDLPTDLPAEAVPATSDSQIPGAHEHRRRRRRRRRRRHGAQNTPVQPTVESSGEATSAQQDAAPLDEEPPSDEV
jgi:hypothetical protein